MNIILTIYSALNYVPGILHIYLHFDMKKYNLIANKWQTQNLKPCRSISKDCALSTALCWMDG